MINLDIALDFTETAAPRQSLLNSAATTAIGAGMGQGRGLVPEEISGRAAHVPLESPAPAIPANTLELGRTAAPAVNETAPVEGVSDPVFPTQPSAFSLQRSRRPVTDYTEAQRRLLILQAFNELTQRMSPKAAARQLGKNRSLIWKWSRAVAGHDLASKYEMPDILEKLARPLMDPAATRPQGRCSDWAPLLLMPSVRQTLIRLYAATIGSSSDATANDVTTGNMMATLQHFTRHVECPEGLKQLILARKVPVVFKRFFGQITPEVEALLKGEKHFQLYGFSGRRDKTIGLPDGRRAYQPANWKVELDDMSVNQPYWTEGPDGKPILSRQGLYARTHQGRWMCCMLVSRVRESYTSADILRFIRKLCETYGKPAELVLEQSVWAAGNIKGYKLKSTGELDLDENGKPIDEVVQRPAMRNEERKLLTGGLEAIGIKVTYVHTPRGKAVLEGGFRTLQTHLAMLTMEWNNIGRHAGEFENPAKQQRRVRAESYHPRDVGFPHQSQLLLKIQEAFDFLNSLPHKGQRPGDPFGRDQVMTTHDELYLHDDSKWPRPQLTLGDYDVFLPDKFERTIDGGAVYPQIDNRELPFRAEEFAHLGDGFRVYGRCDRTEPTLGAAIYCRESASGAKNRRLDNPLKAYAPGEFICWARFDAPGAGTHADSVPEGVPTTTVEQLYGPGAVADGGALLKAQQKQQRLYVRTGFIGGRPGQPRLVINEARNGTAVARVEQVSAAGTPATAGSPGADTAQKGSITEPRLPEPPKRRNFLDAPSAEEFERDAERRARRAEHARALREDQ